MENTSSAEYLTAVSMLPKINSNLYLPLYEKCGGIEGFFKESREALSALLQENYPGLPFPDRTKALAEGRKELEEADRNGILICSIEDNIYPNLLKECEDVPLVLYYKGNLSIQSEALLLAVVGTRKASILCKERTDKSIEELTNMGCTPIIISGLAFGIDASAHRASIRYGLRTFAVLGHGLHTIYPAAHRQLSEEILKHDGALISEFPCQSSIHPSNFLKRNRIIAGMCQATLIAESAEKGGAMSTARTALSYNREVMAFPGRPEDKYSSGCNRLIKENVAALVENGQDIANILGFHPVKTEARQLTIDLFEETQHEHSILTLLSTQGEMHTDELKRNTGMEEGDLMALLIQMELEGKILALRGGRFTII